MVVPEGPTGDRVEDGLMVTSDVLREGPHTQKRRVMERLSVSSGWFYEIEETLQKAKTAYQEIEVVHSREFGTVLLLDGATQVMEKNEFQYHEPMVHLAMLAHPNPRRLLIIGGGDGGILREVLRHPMVEQVDFVELDEEVVRFSRQYLPHLNGGAFEDPRVRFFFQDGRRFVETCTDHYDGIIMDMTDPMGPSLFLYTKEFFSAVSRLFKDDGSFYVMHSESPETRPLAFNRIHRTLSMVFPVVRPAYTYVRMYGSLWSFSICSQKLDPAELPPAEIEKRLSQRALKNLRLIAPTSWQAFFTTYPYIEALRTMPGDISTDAQPEFPDSFDYHG
ncbi:MAG: polyamine aminopropyltransferase [Treponemataceae bacterium]|nr:polyamine aminopropyltransferase [Treponemataceae bacterium]